MRRIQLTGIIDPLRLLTPTFDVAPNSQWRNLIKATWGYLTQHYKVEANPVLGSQIDVSLAPHYTLTDLRRIASSAIHFEPALEALLSKHRDRHPDTHGPGNPNARSNWLDSPLLARHGFSRSHSVAAVENAADEEAVIRLMTGPKEPNNPWANGSYAWSFLDFSRNHVIGFRKPPTPLSSNDVLSWAEFTMTFIQASIRTGSAAALREFPSDLSGLRSFLGQVPSIAGVNEPRRWQKLWTGRHPNGAMEPAPCPDDENDLITAARLNRRLQIDRERIRESGGVLLDGDDHIQQVRRNAVL
jgi:hypothetical protein